MKPCSIYYKCYVVMFLTHHLIAFTSKIFPQGYCRINNNMEARNSITIGSTLVAVDFMEYVQVVK